MQILLLFAAASAVLFAVKWLLLKREVRTMAHTVRKIREAGATNRQLTTSGGDRDIAALANAVNALYEDAHRERAAHAETIAGVRQSMADISHDLRTPLTSILGYVQLLEKGAAPEETARYLCVVRANADTLHRLVGSLFELARLESRAYSFQLETLDAGEVLSDELAGIYTQMAGRGLTPQLELWQAPLWMIGDRFVLGRVFANLLQNMVRHGAGDICVSSRADEREVVFSFSNRVEDMRAEDVHHLFRRSFVADRMRTGESAGLGLSIVKEFVEQTDGAVEACLEADILTFTLRWKKAK